MKDARAMEGNVVEVDLGEKIGNNGNQDKENKHTNGCLMEVDG